MHFFQIIFSKYYQLILLYYLSLFTFNAQLIYFIKVGIGDFRYFYYSWCFCLASNRCFNQIITVYIDIYKKNFQLGSFEIDICIFAKKLKILISNVKLKKKASYVITKELYSEKKYRIIQYKQTSICISSKFTKV